VLAERPCGRRETEVMVDCVVPMAGRWLFSVVCASSAICVMVCGACGRFRKDHANDDNGDLAPPVVVSAEVVVPPAATVSPSPSGQRIDFASLESEPPFVQAKMFRANGQLWKARLVLEPKALGAEGTKDEAELLAHICQEQADPDCVDACGRKLGKKIKYVPPAPSKAGTADAGSAPEAPLDADPDLTRARELVAKKQYEAARKLLEPGVLDGTASTEAVRLLRTTCEKKNDRLCIALCDAKLKN